MISVLQKPKLLCTIAMLCFMQMTAIASKAYAKSGSLFIPIGVGEQFIVIPRPIDANEYKAKIIQDNHGRLLTWSADLGAEKYAIQVLNDNGQWETLLYTTGNSIRLDDRFNDFAQVRVAACYSSSCSLVASGSVVQNIFDTQYADLTTSAPNNASYISPSAPHVDNVGTIKGSAAVSGGGASYSMPIELTAGRAGMQPSVSLNYSSRSGGGLAGKGWSLSAGSAITRCAATYAQEGYSENPQYDNDDRLCLNGQKLILISGRYGQHGAKYRTEMDSFALVTQSGALNSTNSFFSVKYKNGHVSAFGASSNSRDIRSQHKGPYAWLIDYTRDATNKNFIHYNYVEYGNNELLLDKINYTGNSKSHEGIHNIHFEYEHSGDPTTKYLHGISYDNTQRLKRIITKHNTHQTREYTLAYKTSLASGSDLLASVELCYGTTGSNCLPKTTFDWADQATKVKGTFVDINAGKSISAVLPNGDRNGDGARDWPGFYIDAEGNTTRNTHPMTDCEFSGTSGSKVNCNSQTADFNLDGLTDDFDFVPGSSGSKKKLVIYRSNKNGTSTKINTNIEIPQLSSFLHVGDMNGDSLPDLVIYEKTTSYSADSINFYYHSGNFGSPYSSSYKQELFKVNKRLNTATPSESYALGGDFDGNGIPDFYRVSHGTNDKGQGALTSIQLMSANGRLLSSFPKTVNLGDESDYIHRHENAWARFYRFADLNGDGLKDWFGWYKPKTNGSKLYVRYSTGGGSFSAPVYTGTNLHSRTFIFEERFGFGGDRESIRSAIIPKYGDAIKVADIDADGKEELLMPSGIKVRGCHNVSHFEFRGSSVTELCGEEIYTETVPSGNGRIKSVAGSYDRSIYSFVKLELKDGNFVRSSTDFIGSIYQSAMVDAQGDGLPDLVFNYGCERGSSSSNCRFLDRTPTGYAEGKVNISRNYGTGSGTNGSRYRPVDLLNSVTNGEGLKSEWQYRPLSSSVSTGITGLSKLYQSDTATVKGYQNFTSSMYVVNEFKQDNGIRGDFVRRYAYRGALFNNQGRGFTGFRSIIEADITKGLITQSDFRQHFPYSGKLKRKATFALSEYPKNGSALNSVENQAISQSETSWADNSNHKVSGVYNIYANSSYEVTRDLDTKNVLVEKRTTVLSIDAYGNIIKSEQTLDDNTGVVKTITENTYQNNASNWWINKLVTSTVTKEFVSSRSSNDPYYQYRGSEKPLDSTTRITTNYSNFNNARKAEKVVVSASSGEGHQTEYQFNSYGLPTRTTKTARVYNDARWTNQSRSESISYTLNGGSASASGYYVYEMVNAKGHKTRIITDPKTGLKKEVHKQVNSTNYLTKNFGYDNYLRPYSQKIAGSPTLYTAVQRAGNFAPSNAVKQIKTVAAGAPEQVVFIDKLGRTIRTMIMGQDNAWIMTDTTFNAKGYPLFESQPYKSGLTKYGVHYENYDVLGRVDRKVTDQQCSPFASGTMTAQYTYNGFKTNINVSESCYNIHLGEMSRSYNGLNQLIETVDALGGRTRYAYNGQGLPIVIRDANGFNILAKYDAFGNKLRVVDPNQGSTNFVYNGFGEVQRETRGNSKSVHYNVDVLGRIIKRNATGESSYSYTFDTRSYGQLSSSVGNGVTHSYLYDNVGRPISHTVSGDNHSFTTKTFYDANYGRIKGMRYPNNLTLEYIYDDKGYQTETKNKASGYRFQQVTARDVFGAIQSQTLGNGLKTNTYYSRQTGQMVEHYTHKNNTNLLSIQYTAYDGFGNLKGMSVASGSIADRNEYDETYQYDHLHRLKSNQIQGYTTISYAYDAVGNITKKSDYASTYNYTTRLSGHSGGGANAVKQVNKNGRWVGFSYDGRGNMIRGDGLSAATYNAMDKPTRITKHGITADFVYGPDHMRFKQVQSGKTTYYAGKHYEIDVEGNKTTTRAYIGDVAVISTKSGSSPYIRYLHKDRLGSARLITNANGYVISERNFDPFGKPRAASGALKFTAKLDDIKSAKTNRGFTDHEHLDALQLIHMNGRVYDYNLGRFMSVDPIIQSPGNSQSVNPYSYIMNNPLGGTDPTGYSSACQSKGTRAKSEPTPGCANAMSYEVGDKDKFFVDGGNLIVDVGGKGENFIKVDTMKRSGANGVVQNIDLIKGTVTFDIGSQESNNHSLPNSPMRNGHKVRQRDGTVFTPSKENGVLSVDADGVPKFDKNHDDYHEYYLNNSCSKAIPGCTLERVRQGLVRYPAPGANGKSATQDEQIGYALGVGLVRHEISKNGTVINVTLPPNESGIFRHILAPGIVRRWVSEDRNNVYIHTYGVGTGPFATLNEGLKNVVWYPVDTGAFDWATGPNR
ncbi:RHS repeat-associated core domain-containing protein [Pseudoalteromonas luteoviolacea]|uniref:Insecticide toxin TcdB middle/N-terminal domain-containing protein n=1 Tax=Pseudoalteromonas luteoviolacea S4054 TaxID=1129367 RepID=A0A0F6A610_9GAMM|nr:RHS repeat-associated core domain-containing protein [Pseudoalteromonas luteoviolacea]AOT07731.1 hypothetical protein S4054249_07695 [Pseudoalteromonas luteoviolacea]AOT12647.1 hypothetical protein S40542_07695 [Pseudoalteromonas luteoviolacea]AOT17561.1 hypothetical protein S4054_07695 [Pseudoalteromonas luteoviolacea]KKE81605.1 hypothetical protein N479_22165 [Pseudoalteromonas luteoviolacea S4054]KZN78859.1 hypothetical protein N481_00020 [Pseudoalteromonas luteoviolacea S4047-1]